MTLLADFKAARLRRDECEYGSIEWAAADLELRALQREIFVVSPEEPATPTVEPG